MIEIWICNNCGFEAIDMAFYKRNSIIGICPKCNSNDDIKIREDQSWKKNWGRESND